MISQQLSERFGPYKTQNISYTYGSKHRHRFSISILKGIAIQRIAIQGRKIDVSMQLPHIQRIISQQLFGAFQTLQNSELIVYIRF